MIWKSEQFDKEQNYKLNIQVKINKVWEQSLERGVENGEKKNLTFEKFLKTQLFLECANF